VRFADIAALTDALRAERVDHEYGLLCRRLVAKLARTPLLRRRAQPASAKPSAVIGHDV
jgi:hypothetical protein